MTEKEQKYGLWIARLFIPVLWPIRFLIVLPIKRVYFIWMARSYPKRLRNAKKLALKLNEKTGKKQFGVKIISHVEVWSRSEVKIQNKYFGKKLGKPFDYRRFVVFTCENGKINECYV